MSDEYRNPVFKKWLDTLQQESWQLELIISGFALYALFSAFTPISMEVKRAAALDNTLQIYLLVFLLASLFILILNLTIHVILRGLWIGAIGLRYVSGEIDYVKLNYTRLFSDFLEERVGSFDKFIAHLEKYCSVIFAITFLTVFYILSVFAIIGSLIFVSWLNAEIENDTLSTIFSILMILVYGVGMLLLLVDFFTQGWLKRNKWLSGIYYPYYRIFSLISLSFIYRPIIYNLLDNKFGRRLSFLLMPLYVVIIILASTDQVNSNFIPIDFEDDFQQLVLQEHIAGPVNYEDQLGTDKFVSTISVPSKIINVHYLSVFIPFNEAIEVRLYTACPGLEPEDDRRGITTSVLKIEPRDINQRREATAEFLDCFQSHYMLRIDSTSFSEDFLITMNLKEQRGFQTILPLTNIQSGKHVLHLLRASNDTGPGSSPYTTIARIPFWYFPDP